MVNIQRTDGITAFHLSETDSTNNEAKRFAEGALSSIPSDIRYESGRSYLFVADSQTSGRGRRGRSFSSREGGLYMSLLFSPHLRAQDSVHLTTFAATCLCEVIKEYTEVPVGIKWVNDIYARGKKLAGILTEGKIGPEGDLEYSIIGIGINLTPTSIPTELKDVAVSLGELTSAPIPTAAYLARSIACKLSSFDGEKKASYINKYRTLCITLNKRVTVHAPEGDYEAFAEQIEENGNLHVRCEDGEIRSINFGDVSIKPHFDN